MRLGGMGGRWWSPRRRSISADRESCLKYGARGKKSIGERKGKYPPGHVARAFDGRGVRRRANAQARNQRLRQFCVIWKAFAS